MLNYSFGISMSYAENTQPGSNDCHGKQGVTVYLNLRVSHPDVFKERIKNIKTVKHNFFILVVEFTWATCFDLV
jgi:hypothetical protein